MITDPTKRHDFAFLFDVQDGNPNGDPDAGNMPRVDPETMHGLVTDVCIKRKIRDYIDQEYGTEDRMKLYIQRLGILANLQKRAYTELGIDPQDSANDQARQWMCNNFYDIRMFGAVMNTGKVSKTDKKAWNCGQVRGPVQFTFSRSIDPICPIASPAPISIGVYADAGGGDPIVTAEILVGIIALSVMAGLLLGNLLVYWLLRRHGVI